MGRCETIFCGARNFYNIIPELGDLGDLEIEQGFLLTNVKEDKFAAVAQCEEGDANFRMNGVAVNLLDVIAGPDLLTGSFCVENETEVASDRQQVVGDERDRALFGADLNEGMLKPLAANDPVDSRCSIAKRLQYRENDLCADRVLLEIF